MNRLIYVNRTGKYELINLDDLRICEPFILCESDGTPVGHFVAATRPSREMGVLEFKE